MGWVRRHRRFVTATAVLFVAALCFAFWWKLVHTPEYLCLTGDAQTKLHVISYLHRKSRGRSRRILSRLLRDEHPAVRRDAARAAARIGLVELAPRIEQLARSDADARVRAQAIETLVQLDPARAHALVRQGFGHPEREIRIVSAQSARAYDHVGDDALLNLLRDPDPTVREAALHAVADRRLMAAVPILAGDLATEELFELTQTHDALIEITQQNLGIKAENWMAWYEARGNDE